MKKHNHLFDHDEFLLLVFGVLILLVIVGWQTGTLPEVLTQTVLGTSSGR